MSGLPENTIAAAAGIAPVLRALYARHEGIGFAPYLGGAASQTGAAPAGGAAFPGTGTADSAVAAGGAASGGAATDAAADGNTASPDAAAGGNTASPDAAAAAGGDASAGATTGGGAVLELESCESAAQAFDSWITKNGRPPNRVHVQGAGLFGLGRSYAEAIGAAAAAPDGPMAGKIFLITGAAQGFGEGLAHSMAAKGAAVAAADLNGAGAEAVAGELRRRYGTEAIGLSANVADSASVQKMVEDTVLHFGGLDVMISCAGVLIAGDLGEMTKEKFETVTAVNYTGYFLCAKYASKVLKLQAAHDGTHMYDIIEINSKSGLEGSKANFAYAGSKFGGIGLTQSFALELAPHGIKVNAICPGNLLDGPLWSNPERGLFRQYLDAGKVPGAKTVADVRRHYESKVPLGRGCEIADVARAVAYIVEQQYETGQALPVTGGQVMLG